MKHISNAEFGGQCAFAVSLGKKNVNGNGKHFIVKDNKKYLFSNPVAKFLWNVIPGSRKKSESNWSNK